jgi:hypothetical protein
MIDDNISMMDVFLFACLVMLQFAIWTPGLLMVYQDFQGPLDFLFQMALYVILAPFLLLLQVALMLLLVVGAPFILPLMMIGGVLQLFSGGGGDSTSRGSPYEGAGSNDCGY